MNRIKLVAALAAVAVLGGCATAPIGPTVAVVPGANKTVDQFRADDYACRQYAGAVAGVPAAQAANDAAAANAVAGTAIGAAAGALIGAASGNAGPGAAIGAGTGLLFGSAAASNASAYSSYGLQRNYDMAYAQCMYSRGNGFPGRPTSRIAAPAYPPPNTPPPRVAAPAPVPPGGTYAVPSWPPAATPPVGTPPPQL